MGEVLHEPVLGELVWEAGLGKWRIALGTFRGRPVPGLICPDGGWDPYSPGPEMDRLCRIAFWALGNEASVRQHVADAMYDLWLDEYYDPDIDDKRDEDGFRDELSLVHLQYYYSSDATVIVYDSGDLFAGLVSVDIGADCELGEPEIIV